MSNRGKSSLTLKIITEGTPERSRVNAASNGLELTVSYRTADGRPLSVLDLPLGTTFSAIVTLRNPSAINYNQLVLTQVFPAGWEILNTRYLNGGTASSATAGVSYQDIRDEQINSYIDLLPAGRQITLQVDLCAVYAGQFPTFCQQLKTYLGNRFAF